MSIQTTLIGMMTAACIAAIPCIAPAGTISSDADTTPPTVPTNLRPTGTSGGQVVLSWDPSTDDSGTIAHYWVLADGQQIYRPRLPTVNVADLVAFCHLIPGRTYTITIEAVDPSLNRSAPSAPLDVTVN